jgi:hypothetical protein
MKPQVKAESKKTAAENKIEAEKHLKAAIHHEESAKRHREAAKHYTEGEDQKAYELAIQAHKHEILLPVYNPEDRNQHAAM